MQDDCPGSSGCGAAEGQSPRGRRLSRSLSINSDAAHSEGCSSFISGGETRSIGSHSGVIMAAHTLADCTYLNHPFVLCALSHPKELSLVCSSIAPLRIRAQAHGVSGMPHHGEPETTQISPACRLVCLVKCTRFACGSMMSSPASHLTPSCLFSSSSTAQPWCMSTQRCTRTRPTVRCCSGGALWLSAVKR